MIESPININRPRNMAVMILISLAFAFLAGSVLGRYSIRKIVTGNPRYAVVLQRSARDLFTISRLLNSQSEMKRLSGYYGLYENQLIDTDFLVERLDKEASPVVRRTIIWLLGFSKDEKSALESLSGAYSSGNPLIREEVLRSMKRVDSNYYTDFLKKESGGKKGAPVR